MIGRTHDLAAFSALSYVVATQPIESVSLSTAIVAFSANFIGGLFPDIDQSTASLWRRIPAGSIFGKLIAPLIGGHRLLTHSLVGVVLTGLGLKYILGLASSVLLVNMEIVWWAFMIGVISHLIMDSFTRDGVPFFFPFPIVIGIPPIRSLRIKTGGVIEKFVVFPGLILVTAAIYYYHYDKFLTLLKQYLER